MSRLARALVGIALSLVVAGCSTTTPPKPGQPSPTPPAPLPSAARSSAPPEVATPSPMATKLVGPTGLVAYAWRDRLWVVNADGTGAHELLPTMSGVQEPIAWSADGSRLLYRTATGVGLTDPAGARPEELELVCPTRADSDPVLVSCQVDRDAVALSPDGGRLAYPIREGTHDQSDRDVASALVVLDLATALATRLGSTEMSSPLLEECGADNDGGNHSPSWSPEGDRLAFARVTGPETEGSCQTAVLIVNADGSSVRQVVAPGQLQGSIRPVWSPDGSSLVLGGAFVGPSGETKVTWGDIYIVRSDGADLHALTGDRASLWPAWTRDNRLSFVRWLSPEDLRGDNWVMNADGGSATPVEATVHALTAAGCLTCTYPMSFDEGTPVPAQLTPPLHAFETFPMLWQP
jgi:WD40 repeat protein